MYAVNIAIDTPAKVRVYWRFGRGEERSEMVDTDRVTGLEIGSPIRLAEGNFRVCSLTTIGMDLAVGVYAP